MRGRPRILAPILLSSYPPDAAEKGETLGDARPVPRLLEDGLRHHLAVDLYGDVVVTREPRRGRQCGLVPASEDVVEEMGCFVTSRLASLAQPSKGIAASR